MIAPISVIYYLSNLELPVVLLCNVLKIHNLLRYGMFIYIFKKFLICFIEFLLMNKMGAFANQIPSKNYSKITRTLGILIFLFIKTHARSLHF